MLDEMKMLEVSWVIERTNWGSGYGTEAGHAALAFAFDEFEADEVCAPIHQENVASRHVAEKIGMRMDALVDVYRDGVLLANYIMSREGWQNRKRESTRFFLPRCTDSEYE